MLTKLLNHFLIQKAEKIELIPAIDATGGYFNAYSYCSDGSCSGDCVGGCDGTPAGGF